jgi:hypothetical protein
VTINSCEADSTSSSSGGCRQRGTLMNTRVWPVSHARLARLFGASALISAMLLFSSQLAPAWVFTPWTQQQKLVGTGASGFSQQGRCVALSAAGNTAILGSPGNSSNTPAWVFTRSGTTWTQQQKLVVAGGSAFSTLGQCVALSAAGQYRHPRRA